MKNFSLKKTLTKNSVNQKNQKNIKKLLSQNEKEVFSLFLKLY
jgi:hypothetical protein